SPIGGGDGPGRAVAAGPRDQAGGRAAGPVCGPRAGGVLRGHDELVTPCGRFRVLDRDLHSLTQEHPMSHPELESLKAENARLRAETRFAKVKAAYRVDPADTKRAGLAAKIVESCAALPDPQFDEVLAIAAGLKARPAAPAPPEAPGVRLQRG